ncbi:MAG: phosphatase PAP2 family protein [Candidatus Eremiobacteraeota bacterium]|nr:phosphatase PAP2 family protein [Candidatus Eremiobacteraeota bacterium]MBV8499126.1 phosphatase PAP2 family protein [Candidatus Eremiobacteraeota bacterium]
MTARRIVLLALLLAATALAPLSPQTATGYYYLDPRRVDLAILLPPPPEAGSPEARADMAAVNAAVSARSPAQLLQAREASQRNVFFFAQSVGPSFTPERLPLTAAFFARIGGDVQRLVLSAKEYWERPRPGGAPTKHGSYPSGHAAFASSTAILLAQLLPEKRYAIFSQARIFAADRVMLGVHYPTDVASGWTAGTLAAYVMMNDAAFRRDFARVENELRGAHLTAAAR